MKTRLKNMTDLNRTGNKPLKLTSWEKILLGLLKGESNPTVIKVPGSLQIGILSYDELSPVDVTLSTSSIYTNQDGPSTSSFDPMVNNKNNSRKHPKLHCKTDNETEETRGLSTIELQRLVSLEQLATSRTQKEAATLESKYFKAQIEPMDVL